MAEKTTTFDRLTGSFPVVPTPFLDDFTIDLDSLGRLLDRLIDSGLSGLTLLGSSSETTYLTEPERGKVLEFALARLARRVTTVVGIIRFGTQQAVEEGKRALDLGADALMVALPQYFKTPTDDVIAHYEAFVRSTGAPVLYYHYPEPTNLHLDPKQINKLFERVALCGIKESGFSTPELIRHMRSILRPVRIFTGQSFNLMDALEAGAAGAICPAGVLMPKTSMALCTAVEGGDRKGARVAQERLYSCLPVLTPGTISARLAQGALKFGLRFGVSLPRPAGVPHAGLKEALAATGILRSAAVRPPQPAVGQKKRDEIRALAPLLSEL